MLFVKFFVVFILLTLLGVDTSTWIKFNLMIAAQTNFEEMTFN